MPRPTLPLPVKHRKANRLAPSDGPRGLLRVSNVASDTTELLIYGYIGDYYSGISSEQVIDRLNEITTPKLTIRINSGGGDVFEGAAIYNAIRRHPSEKTATIDGLAASAASWIALAADKIVIGTGAWVMVHNVASYAFGEADALRAEADLIEKMTANIAAIYAAKTGSPVENWVALMDAETWFTAAEAIEAGLADEQAETVALAEDPAAVEVTNKTDLSRFAHVPGELQNKKAPQTPRDVESVLRDAGLSRSAAKAAVSNLRDEAQRDADADVWRGIGDIANGLKTLNEARKLET